MPFVYRRCVRLGRFGPGISSRFRRRGVLAGIAAGLTLALAQGAFADTAPIASSPDLPWSNPLHQSPLELLAGQIASHIAGRTVGIECDGDAAWATLVTQRGGDPNAESGYVATSWNGTTGQMISNSSVADLATSVCSPLNAFAMATTKPTKCATSALLVRAAPARPGAAASRVHGVDAQTSRRALGSPVPCYLGGGKTAASMPSAFWAQYATYSVAILTLAHESVHLGGMVGGQLSNGLSVGDPQAEAKADCYGMQWMPYVAEQLGDTPDDAQAIATYFWDTIYPLARTSHPMYWSPDCRPGGALDVRPPGAVAWP
jgi:hypothetical protein